MSLDAAGAQQPDASPPTIRVCKQCTHYRERAKRRLFSPDELHSAGVLKAQAEWEEQQKQHAQREVQFLADPNHAFTYEPHSIPWCAAYTKLADVEQANAGDETAIARLMREGGAAVDAVSGRFSPVYALCIRMNPFGRCERYDPR